jgi:5-methyltetrahydrofolate--homocysteine methyltransferase
MRIPFSELLKRRINRLLHETKAEKKTSEILKRMGIRFNREEIIGPYIVDFVGIDLNFILEIDGSFHNGREEHDDKRDNYLTNKGYSVFRIENDDVNEATIVKILLRARKYDDSEY